VKYVNHQDGGGSFQREQILLGKKFWPSMSFKNLVRLSQIEKCSLPDYAHVNKVSKKLAKCDN
jgi:hypothetical protein